MSGEEGFQRAEAPFASARRTEDSHRFITQTGVPRLGSHLSAPPEQEGTWAGGVAKDESVRHNYYFPRGL